MKVLIDSNSSNNTQALVCIIRGKRGSISYNSGLIYFNNDKAIEEFTTIIKETNPEVEVIPVDTREAHPPRGDIPKKGYWCPYCQSWEYWSVDSSGSHRCPICGISSREYYVKKYNDLWAANMKSKTSKKRMDKAAKKNRKGRK